MMDKILLPKKINGPRIVLKKNTLRHAKEIFKCVDSDRERLRIFLSWVDKTTKLEDEINFIKTSGTYNNRPMFSYGMFHEGNYIGGIGVINVIWEDDVCELGYWVHQKHEGKGYISEAVSTLEKILFSSGFHRIQIRCEKENIRSIEVAKRNGYKFEKIVWDKTPTSEKELELMVFVKTMD
ncbi:MAG: GNAT family N-acetyltransferase [Proteobacteria bacterium]|nr:GNAT family N-acetyltransferase [Pseudomonadota bacterium]